MNKHALLSPSTAHRWASCPGSVALSMGLPEAPSKYADEGSDAHFLAAECLFKVKDAAAFEGRVLPNGTTVDSEMARYVQEYLDLVRSTLAPEAELAIERAYDISFITGEEGAEGTADAVVLAPAPGGKVLHVFDLKYGKGVQVAAVENRQLIVYAAAAYGNISLYDDVSEVVLHIVQPRLGHHDVWALTPEQLRGYAEEISRAAAVARAAMDTPPEGRGESWQQEYLRPGEEQCRWCRAKTTCPALGALSTSMVETTLDGIHDLDATVNGIPSADDERLLNWYSMLGAIEAWCSAVKAEAFRRASEGRLTGYKLVSGKRGPRVWASPEEAEKAMKALRLKAGEMYERKLITPSQAEKLLKKEPRRWARLQGLITQSPGKPVLVPATDPRPALPAGVAGLINSDVEDLV